MQLLDLSLGAAAAMIAITNPIGNAPVFVAIAGDRKPGEQRKAVFWVCLYTLVILSAAALFGGVLLKFFGISLAAFKAAGAILIISIGLNMSRGEASAVQEDKDSDEDLEQTLFMPFTVPMIAGPGSIATVMTVSVNSRGDETFTTTISALIGVAAACVVLAVVLLAAAKAERYISQRAQRVFTRFFGMILLAIGIQLGLSGVKTFFTEAQGDEPPGEKSSLNIDMTDGAADGALPGELPWARA